MAEDSDAPERTKQLDNRLNYLETVARDTVARLYEIEKRLGLVFRAVPRELKTPAQIEREGQLSRPRADKEALKSTTRSQKQASQEEQHTADPGQPRDTSIRSEQAPPPPPERRPERPRVIEKPAPPAQPITAVPLAPAEPARISLPPTAVDSHAPVVKTPPTAVHPITQATRAEQMRQTQTLRPREASQERPDLESRIGGRWLLWIGVVAISFGMAFFLKYAFDNQWITPGWRVNIGVAIGLGFLLGADRLRNRYPIYSHGLAGGGVFILYLSIFVGCNTYALLSRPLALGLMAAVTATASLLSARYNALPIAILGLIGGFLTPILLSTGVDNEAGLFGYIALLDLGVLALAYSKQWRSLNYMAFTATVAMFAAWMITWYAPEKLGTTMLFLTVFFMIFALLAVLHNVVNRRPTLWIDLAMVFSNALLYFSASYELLEDNHHGILGLFAVLVSAFYMGLGYFTYSRDREDSLLIYTFLALAFLFGVLAVPIQLDQHWVTMGWALEGAAMTWIGLRANDRTSRYAALVVFGIAVAHWFNTDVREFAYHANENFLPLLNRRALSCAVFVGALAAAALFYKQIKSNVADEERSMFTGLYVLGANALAVILLSLDAFDYFEQAKRLATDSDQVRSVVNTKALTLTALWAIYGAGALFVGVVRRLKPLRFLALLLLAGATVKVLVVDLNYYAASWHSTIFNPTFAAFASIVAALAFGARFYARGLEPDDEERESVLPILIGAANVLAVIALAAEALGYFDRAQAIESGQAIARLENTKQLALSAVWIIYGGVALLIGIRRRSQAVRIGSLILLALASAKAVSVDLGYYNAEWHTLLLNPTFAAFALLITAFAAGAWFYSRAEDIAAKARAIPILVGVANLLAVIALSAETLGYFDRAQTIASGEATVQLENAKQLALTAVWTIYGATALIIGIRRRSKTLRIGSLILLALATLKVVSVDLWFYDARWHTLLFNPTFAAFVLLVGSLAAGAWFYAHAQGIAEKERALVIPILVGAANLLAIIALSAEAIGYFEQAKAQVAIQLSSEISRLDNNEHLALTALWTIYGGAALIIGINRRSRPLRLGALMLLVVATFKLLVVDLKYYRAPWHTLIINETFAAFALIILALASSAWFYSRAEDIDEDERTMFIPLMVGGFNVLAIVALSAEVLGYFGKNMRAEGVSSDELLAFHLARQLWLSLVWTIYGGAMLTVGIARRSKLLRVMALLLLGLTIFKVFLFDLSSLVKLYRIISFIVLGAILLAVSFLYQRYRQRMSELIGDSETPEPMSAE
ncbi:MAG: DUF2339 domain-containing protein [Acidobacteriota bacterium]